MALTKAEKQAASGARGQQRIKTLRRVRAATEPRPIT
jgi:hypothetical protein